MMSNNSSNVNGERIASWEGKAEDKRMLIQQSKETQRNKGIKHDGIQSPLKFT
jgi:hypothetical protein